MIKSELYCLFTRYGLTLIIIAICLINIFVVYQNVNSQNEYGFSISDINAVYNDLPEDAEYALYFLNDKIIYYNFASFSERMLYTELTKRVSDAVNYNTNLQARLSEAQLMLDIPFFAPYGTFDNRNLNLLLHTYNRINEKNIIASPVSSVGIELVTETYFTDIALIFISLTLTIGIFMLPKEENLYLLIKPMYKGHFNLFISKLIFLFIALFVAMIFTFGANLIIAHIHLGFGDFLRSVQSLYGFSTSRFSINVWQYLLLFFAYKFLWIICITSIIILICVFVRRSIYVFIIVFIFIGVNVLLYQSSITWLKLNNLIWLSDAKWYFSGYYNLSFFGYPIDSFFVSILILVVILISTILCSLIYFSKQENIISERSIRNKHRFISFGTNIPFHEGYKLFIRQQGIIILFLLLLLKIFIVSNQNFHIDPYERYYAQILAGPISNDADFFIISESERFYEIRNNLNHISQQSINGIISEETFRLLSEPLHTQLLAEPAFHLAKNQYMQIKELSAQFNNISFVELQVYEYIFGNHAKANNMLDAIILSVVLSIGLSALLTVERYTHMDMLISTLPYKNNALRSKIGWAVLFSLIATKLVYIPRFVHINNVLGLHQLNASIRSLTFYSSSFGDVSIISQIILVALFWFLLALFGAAVVLIISCFVKTRAVSVLSSTFTLVVFFIIIVTIANKMY